GRLIPVAACPPSARQNKAEGLLAPFGRGDDLAEAEGGKPLPSALGGRASEASAKLSASRRNFKLNSLCELARMRPHPVERARLRKISACRASSIACVAMKFFTSKKSALRRHIHLAGTSVAIISTSVWKVSRWA